MTVGVTETDFDSVSVFVPVDTDAPVELIDEGAVALPLATLFDTCAS